MDINFYKMDAQSVGAKGLVFVGDDVLVYRRDDKAPRHPLSLDVPGGGTEAGETPFQTFQREVKEEFGLDVTQDQIVYARRYPSSFEPDKFGWYAAAKLPASVRHHIKFGDEGVEYFLMPLDEFLNAKDAWPIYQQRAADYARYVQVGHVWSY